MLYFIITILALCVFVMFVKIDTMTFDLKNSQENEKTQFNRAERYFKYKRLYFDMEDIIESDLMKYDKYDKIKELVDNLEPEN